MYVYIDVCIYIYIYVDTSLPLSLSIYIYLYLYLSLYTYIYIYTHGGDLRRVLVVHEQPEELFDAPGAADSYVLCCIMLRYSLL